MQNLGVQFKCKIYMFSVENNLDIIFVILYQNICPHNQQNPLGKACLKNYQMEFIYYTPCID